MRIGPYHVPVGDPEAIPIIYGLKSGFTKVWVLMYTGFTRWIDDTSKTGFYPIQSIPWQKKPQMSLFSTRDEVYPQDQKRAMAGAYSMSSLLEMEDAVNSCSTLLKSNLSGYASLGNSLDLRVSHHLRGRHSKPQPLSVIL